MAEWDNNKATMMYHKASIPPAVRAMMTFSPIPASGRTNWLKSARKKSAILAIVGALQGLGCPCRTAQAADTEIHQYGCSGVAHSVKEGGLLGNQQADAPGGEACPDDNPEAMSDSGNDALEPPARKRVLDHDRKTWAGRHRAENTDQRHGEPERQRH